MILFIIITAKSNNLRYVQLSLPLSIIITSLHYHYLSPLSSSLHYHPLSIIILSSFFLSLLGRRSLEEETKEFKRESTASWLASLLFICCYCCYCYCCSGALPCLPPSFTLPYQGILQLAHSSVLLKILYNVFSEADNDESKVWSSRLLHQVRNCFVCESCIFCLYLCV